MRHFLAALLVALAASPTIATTWHILPDGTGDAPTIQAGIDAASPGDAVEVACGTYHEHDIHLDAGITLTSESGFSDCVTVDAQTAGGVLIVAPGLGQTTFVSITLAGGSFVLCLGSQDIRSLRRFGGQQRSTPRPRTPSTSYVRLC